MEIDDETVQRYYATRDLLRLYNAYRVTTRAQIAVSQQIRKHIASRSTKDASARDLKLARYIHYEELLRYTDAVYRNRVEQLNRRLNELLEIPEGL